MDKTQSDIALGVLLNMFLMVICTAIIYGGIKRLETKLKQQEQMQYDYKIDLKENNIIIYSEDGGVCTIPHGKLDEFVERDNM